MPEPSRHFEAALTQFQRERARFAKAVSLIMAQCEKLVRLEAIPATVQGRVKTVDSLKGKLIRLNEADEGSISTDLAPAEVLDRVGDLAGVRVTTYVDFDRGRVVELIKQSFEGVSATPRDSGNGYRATHCSLTLNPETLDAWADEPPTRVEVQVSSMLAHVWNEIEHDIRYKEMHNWDGIEARRDSALDSLRDISKQGEEYIEQLIGLKAYVHARSLLPDIERASSDPISLDSDDAEVIREFVRLGYSTVEKIQACFDLGAGWVARATRTVKTVNSILKLLEQPEDLRLGHQLSDLFIALLIKRHQKDIVTLYGRGKITSDLRIVRLASALEDGGLTITEYEKLINAEGATESG